MIDQHANSGMRSARLRGFVAWAMLLMIAGSAAAQEPGEPDVIRLMAQDRPACGFALPGSPANNDNVIDVDSSDDHRLLPGGK
jgi:hypothetical protein